MLEWEQYLDRVIALVNGYKGHTKIMQDHIENLKEQRDLIKVSDMHVIEKEKVLRIIEKILKEMQRD